MRHRQRHKPFVFYIFCVLFQISFSVDEDFFHYYLGADDDFNIYNEKNVHQIIKNILRAKRTTIINIHT